MYRSVSVKVSTGAGQFDTPSHIEYENDGGIPQCRMIFPGGARSLYRLSRKTAISVFFGFDGYYNSTADFIGFLVDETGVMDGRMEIASFPYLATRDYDRLTAYDNISGLEIGNAIQNVFSTVSELSAFNILTESTSPTSIVPDDYLFDDGKSKWDMMLDLADMAVDPTDPTYLGRYALFPSGDTLHFKKIRNPESVTTPDVTLAYGDSLISFDQETSSKQYANKVKVIGNKDNAVYVEYQNDNRVNIDGIREDDPIVDANILTNGEAYETARSSVLKSMAQQASLIVRSPLLLHCVPNHSVIEITGAPYGVSGKYLLRTLNISISPGQFVVEGRVNIPVDIMSDILSQLLKLST